MAAADAAKVGKSDYDSRPCRLQERFEDGVDDKDSSERGFFKHPGSSFLVMLGKRRHDE